MGSLIPQLSLSVMADDAPTLEEIDSWITALGSPQFSKREAATQSLIKAGTIVLPQLRKAIGSGDLEMTTRAIEVARDLLESENQKVATAAERFLDDIASHNEASVAGLAEATLDFHAVGLADAAKEKLQSLGGKLERGLLVTGQQGMHATLDVKWQGNSEDLKLLLRLPGLLIVSMHGVPVDNNGAIVLGRLRRVARIELYGTGLKQAQVEVLEEKLKDTHIEFRKGGKLGVAGHPTAVPCHLTMVQQDSAADKAGLQIGDIVQKINGKDVQNFEELTTIIGTFGPGQKIELEILRGQLGGPGEHLSRSIELDAW